MRHAVLACLLLFAAAPALAQTAILPVKLLDTSGEARDQRADHDRRLALLAQTLQDGLPGIAIGADQAAACQPETTECLLDLAQAAGADRALFIVAHKTSTLILQLFVTLVDAESGRLILSRNLSFRGDTDDSWLRAGRFLAGQLRDAAP